MGCDIHTRFERRRVDGTWEVLVDPTPDEQGLRYQGWRASDALASGRPVPPVFVEFHDRNYNLFSILANVRNGSGFAGVKTGDGYEPISDCRGIPADASPEYQELVEQWNGDGHSHTWVTLDEILDPTWHNKKVTHCGVIPTEEYLKYRETGTRPRSWSSAVWGQSLTTIEESEADQQLASQGSITSTHVRIWWTNTYLESVSWFVEWIRAKVLPMANGEPTTVRMCMFFDN